VRRRQVKYVMVAGLFLALAMIACTSTPEPQVVVVTEEMVVTSQLKPTPVKTRKVFVVTTTPDAAEPQGTPTPIVPIDEWLGEWHNVDPHTAGWVKIEIEKAGMSGSVLAAHFWGKCHPTLCDAGTLATAYEGTSVISKQMDRGFCIRDVTLLLEGDRLHVTTSTHYTDESGREDQTREEYFRR
jgi:hypothetical protein